jgi:hypothetical protein
LTVCPRIKSSAVVIRKGQENLNQMHGAMIGRVPRKAIALAAAGTLPDQAGRAANRSRSESGRSPML